MASATETGHAKNVANFKELIAVCWSLGSSYNPGKAAIKTDALETKLASAEESYKTLNRLLHIQTNAANDREKLFEVLKQLAARINSTVATADLADNLLTDVKTLTRKLQGLPASPKKNNPPDSPSARGGKNIPVSQLIYESQIETLDKLLELLTSLPGYSPNETELSVTGLRALHTNMNSLHQTVVNTQQPIANACAALDTELYHPQTGLVKIAATVKEYIKRVFTIKSPQYKQVANIVFKNIRP